MQGDLSKKLNKKCSPTDASSYIIGLNYAIDKIGHRTLYELGSAAMSDQDLALRRRPYMTKLWMYEFSKLGFEKMREQNIK